MIIPNCVFDFVYIYIITKIIWDIPKSCLDFGDIEHIFKCITSVGITVACLYYIACSSRQICTKPTRIQSCISLGHAGYVLMSMTLCSWSV